MSSERRILAFAGSTRRESYNRKLLREAVSALDDAPVACTHIELRDYPLPLYDGDLEAAEGLPAKAAELRELVASHDGFLIASPEYNGLISPLLKNTIDWTTRNAEGGADTSGYPGKWAALLAASPGALGGMRGLLHVRTLFTNLGCNVLARQVTVRQAAKAFGDDGRLADDSTRDRVASLALELGRLVAAAP